MEQVKGKIDRVWPERQTKAGKTYFGFKLDNGKSYNMEGTTCFSVGDEIEFFHGEPVGEFNPWVRTFTVVKAANAGTKKIDENGYAVNPDTEARTRLAEALKDCDPNVYAGVMEFADYLLFDRGK